jgi:hypothetical protein
MPPAPPRPRPRSPSRTCARHLWAAAVAALVVCVGGAPGGIPRAKAHPFALSAFDAYTDGRDIRFDFKLDATSVVDLVLRQRRDLQAVKIADLPAHRELLFDYVTARFKVTNTDLPCAVTRPSKLDLNEVTSKVMVELRFRCPRELGLVVIDSTLFHDELTPHDFVGNFHHVRGLQRLFMGKATPRAHVNVPAMPQVLPAEIDGARPFRTPPPPPGAFQGGEAVAGVPVTPGGAPGARARTGWAGFAHFVQQGVLHILGGLDHVLFLVSLIIAVRTTRQLLLIVTSFTIAHSLTLVLGSLGLVYMSPRLAEPLIAFSIIYVAAENVLRRGTLARPRVTFAFGLVHGFGFSSVLRDLGFGAGELAPMLVGFNLGVELGQLAIVLPLFPLVAWLQRRSDVYGRVALATNAVVGLVACWWLIERLHG